MLHKYIKRQSLFLLASIIFLYSPLLMAAQFTASVITDKVSLGQSIELTINLTGAKVKHSPDFSALHADFHLHGQQQYSTYSNTNGNVVSQVGWTITLLPKKEGNLVIPSLSVNTDKGLLNTQAINITVSKKQVSGQDPADDSDLGISLITSTNKNQVYVKEPIVYILKIISYKPIVNVMIDDIKATDAIIDAIGQPKQYDQILGGVRAHIIEKKYHITPLVAGTINILPATVSGEIQGVPQANPQPSQRLGMFNHFFFNNPIQFNPFSLQSDKLSIKALAPPYADKQWLPLQNLQLSEEWSALDKVKVGDTIIRKIRMVATGSFSSQLPTVKPFLQIPEVKLYVDKPVLTDNPALNNDAISGSKEESFSIVATKAGKITFPAIKISWWNLRTNKAEVATLPSKTIDFLPTATTNNPNTSIDYSVPVEPVINQVAAANNRIDTKVKYLIFGLLIIMASMLAFIVILLKKRNKPVVTSIEKHNSNNKPITNVQDLRDQIILYASKHWQANNVTLNQLGTYLSNANYTYALDKYINLCNAINSALYANGTAELSLLIHNWHEFKTTVVKQKSRSAGQDKREHVKLNPT